MYKSSFRGEFSWEIVFTVAHAYKAHIQHELLSTRGCYGTNPFYYFSNNHREDLQRRSSLFMSPEIKQETQINKIKGYHDLYKHDLDITGMVYPPYKQHYSQMAKFMGIKFNKPMLVINNKTTIGWGKNKFLDRISLKELSIIAEKFHSHDIVYLRPNVKLDFKDNTKDLKFADKQLMRKFSNVHICCDLMEKWCLDFNTVQLICHSLSDKHISVAGGNACLASHFGGTNIVISKSAPARNRGVWQSCSYLKNISGSKIIGESYISESLLELML